MLENLNEIIVSLFIFLIILFLYLHIQYQLKTSNELEIYEIEQELSKEKMEEICDLRQPIVLDTTEELLQLIPIFSKKSLLQEYSSYEIKIRNKKNVGTIEDSFIPLQMSIADKLFLEDSSKNFYTENNSDFLYESGLIKKIQMCDSILKPHLTCNFSYDVLFGTSDVETPLRYEHNYRNYIMTTEGSVIIRLFPPKYNKYFNTEINYENLEYTSDVNVWNTQEKYKLIMKKMKYLDVELSIGKILYIPAYWLYSIKLCEDSSILTMKYRTYMNIIAISPTLVINLLQNQNIKMNYLKKMELESIATKTKIEIIEDKVEDKVGEQFEEQFGEQFEEQFGEQFEEKENKLNLEIEERGRIELEIKEIE
jgi:hypothetical protein